MNCFYGQILWMLLYYIQLSFSLDLDPPPFIQRPPRIIKQPLEVYYFPSGGDKHIPCEAEANPAVNDSGRYFWKKDGKVLDTKQESQSIGTHDLILPGPHGALTFRSRNTTTVTRLAYHGTYQCFAENSLGTALSTAAVVKIVNSATDLVPSVEDEIIEVREGDSLMKPCVDLKYTRSDKEELKWIFYPTIQNSDRIAQAPNRNIVFSNVAAIDDGLKFYCSSKDLPTRFTIESTHYMLTVLNATRDAQPAKHSAKIVFPPAEQEIVVLKGEELSLSCIATGNPSPSTRWTSSNRFELHDYNRTLRIAAVKYSDAGIYTCTAENELGSMKRNVSVIVESKPYFTNESTKPTDISVKPDVNVKMKCEIAGRPTPAITWMKNGKVLPGRHGMNMHLRNVTSGDTAVYQCVGKNKHGTIIGQGFVNVLAIPPKPWPNFQDTFRKLEGTLLELPCVMFSATQKYNVIWTRDNQQPQANILRDRRIRQRTDHRLVIKNINVDDSDIYRCNASNKYGSTTINMNVTVLFRTTISPDNSRYIVKAGDDVTMVVKVDHDPLMRNVRTSWRTANAITKGVDTTLTIFDAKASDSGKYTVEVETELDRNVTFVYLTVQDRPEFPRNVTFGRDPKNSYSGVLSWNPPVNINFSPLKAYHVDVLASTNLSKGEWERLGSTTNQAKMFLIGDLQPWVRYNFRVWAENGIGMSLEPTESWKTYETPPQAPKINPTDVVAEGTSPDTILVRWNSVDSFQHAGPGFGYDVSWRLAGTGNWKEKFVESGESDLYVIPNTETFTEYEIKVQSSNNEGPGPEPETITTLSGQDIPLASPTIISTREVDKGATLIKWQPIPTETIRGIPTRYIIRCKDVATNKVKKKFVSRDATSATIKLSPYTEYEISVTLENGAGESADKNFIALRTKESIPEAPERFEVVREMLNEIQLKWKKPTKPNGKIIGYVLEYKWEENGKTISTKQSLKDSSDKINALSPNTSFVMTLCAETAAGVGTNCSTLTAATIAPRTPEITEFLVITSQVSFNVTWTNSARDQNDGIPLDGYVVQHRRKENGVRNWTSSEFIPASSVGKYLYTLSKLTPNCLYELRIVATNRYGNRSSTSTVAKTSKKESLSSGAVGGQLWFIIVLCIAALVVLVIVIACLIRKRRVGKYPVSEKEEQLVKQQEAQPSTNPECLRYSTSAADGIENKTADVEEEKREVGPHRLRGDSVSGNSIEAFGAGTTRDYDEDGSFIDQYGLDQRSESRLSSPESGGTNSLSREHRSNSIVDFKEDAV